MTPEQQRALALARARRRRASQGGVTPAPTDRGMGAAIYDNLIGSNDGVNSYGEQLGTLLGMGGESMTMGLVGDEASAAVSGMLPGRSYEGELKRYRGNEKQMREDSPWLSLGADIGGAIIPGLAGAGIVSAARTLPQMIGRGIGLGAGAGATQGFMEGEGGIGPRVQSAGVGGVLGGAIGGLVPAVGAAAKGTVASIGDMIRQNRVGSQVGQALGVGNRTGRVMADLIGQDDPAMMQAALARSGPNAMLADVSPQATGMLDMAMRSPIPAARAAGQAVEGRAAAAYGDVTQAMDNAIGAPRGLMGAQEAIVRDSAPARAVTYNAAYSQPIDYSGPAGAKLLDEITPRLPANAINYANQLMRTKGEKSAQIMAKIADDGTVTFTNPPDVRQWDYIKQAVDFLAETGEGAGALGGQTRMGSAYQGLAREIRDAVGTAVPEYNIARATAADAIDRRKAVEFGATILRPQTTREQVANMVAGAGGKPSVAKTPNAVVPYGVVAGATDELKGMQEGLRSQIDETLANVRAVASDQNIDARAVSKAFSDMSSPAAREKMALVLGDAWPALRDKLDEAGAALGLRARTSPNSATFGRGASEDAINEQVTPGALRRGQPVQALKNTAATAMGASPEAIRKMRDEVKGEIAELLTRQGVNVPKQMIDSIASTLAKNPQNLQAGSGVRKAIEALLLGNSANLSGAVQGRLMPQRQGIQ